MTGFCGGFVRASAAGSARSSMSDLLEIAADTLSRERRHVVQKFCDQNAFMAYFSIGAYEQGRALSDDGVHVSCVAGDPLIVDHDESANEPAASVRLTRISLASPCGALANSAGVFSAVSWNKKTRTLRLCADKLAIRPVYVFVDSKICVYATNVRTLRELVSPALEIDERGLGELIYFGQCLHNRTVFANVRVLRPAELLTLTMTDERSVHYFDWNSVEPKYRDETQLTEQLYTKFIRAIQRRSRRKLETAFLSGGLDSRCVVAGLLDIGRKVRTISSSFPQSADDVISRLVASELGTQHTSHYRDPVERLESTMVRWGLIVRDQLYKSAPKGQACVVFGGHGGSVGLGHVYMEVKSTELALQPLSDEVICGIFPQLENRATRLLRAKRMRRLRELALDSIRRELGAIRPRRKERRLFLYYLLNDQMRHLYEHYEDIDLSAVEIENPFLDSDFLTEVVAAPVTIFLGHRLYNSWISSFKSPAATLAWQAYPGHERCPFPMPEGVKDQWGSHWYRGPRARNLAYRIAAQILQSDDTNVQKYFSSVALRGLEFLNAIGFEHYNYELFLARSLYQSMTGFEIVRPAGYLDQQSAPSASFVPISDDTVKSI